VLYSGCTLVEDSGSVIGPAGVPRGTLSAWKSRYLNNDEFAERIDAKLQESGK